MDIVGDGNLLRHQEKYPCNNLTQSSLLKRLPGTHLLAQVDKHDGDTNRAAQISAYLHKM